MAHEHNSNAHHTRPQVYQIRLKGRLSHEWSDWFDGMTITQADGDETLLTGLVADQAALYGLLRKVRDLGLPLISVRQVDLGQNDTAENPTTRP